MCERVSVCVCVSNKLVCVFASNLCTWELVIMYSILAYGCISVEYLG